MANVDYKIEGSKITIFIDTNDGDKDTVLAKIAKENSKLSEEDGLGVAISRHFEWEHLPILKTVYAALEDANLHTENKTVAEWIKALEGPKRSGI